MIIKESKKVVEKSYDKLLSIPKKINSVNRSILDRKSYFFKILPCDSYSEKNRIPLNIKEYKKTVKKKNVKLLSKLQK
ncbi:hypothetical protein SESBI_04106 [Sesbania bispinosa]|nr:hypothetical protein SESBI_04106 [Sesbania bispinosa]